MKKAICLLVLMIFFVALTTNCKKTDSTPDAPVTPVQTGLISQANLSGYWNFQNYQINGKNYLVCNDVYNDAVTKSKGWIILSFNFTPNYQGYAGNNVCDMVDAVYSFSH